MSKIKVNSESKSNWRNYLIKSKQFLETAQDAYLKENWNAVGLNTIHSIICANDALTIYYKEIRSVSRKHSDAVELFLKIFENDNEAKKSSKHLLWLINKKNFVEYEARLFFQKEAEECLKRADRFFTWTKSKLPKN